MLASLILLTSAAAQGLQPEDSGLKRCHEQREMFSRAKVAMRYLTGELAVEEPIAKTERLLRKARDGAHANGCYNLALASEEGMVEGRGVKDALRYYTIGCHLDDGDSCSPAVMLLLNGDKKAGLETDYDEAMLLGRQARGIVSPGCQPSGGEARA